MGYREMKRQGEFRQEAGYRKEGCEEAGYRKEGCEEAVCRKEGYEEAVCRKEGCEEAVCRKEECEEAVCRKEGCEEAGYRKKGYEENGNRYAGIKEFGYRSVGFVAAIYGGYRIGEVKDNMGRCLKNNKKKWVKAGGILLAVLLTACSGEENDESNTALPSAIELDNIMSEIPEAGDHSSRQPGDASNPEDALQADQGSGSNAADQVNEGSNAAVQTDGGSDAARTDIVSTPEPVREPIEEKLTPEGIGWGLTFGDSGAQPTGNASPQELALYDAYFMKEGDEKVIYLTFDCGYENGNTEKILDALKAHNAPATFFVVGHFLETEPEIVNRMAEEGHAVGNHTYHHYDIDTLDGEEFRKELEDVETLFHEITGEELSPYYRPPEGKCGTTNLKLAKDLGYVTCFWSLAYVDWDPDKQPTHEAALDKLTARIHPGAIVLLHNTSQTNGEILDELLTKWEEMGYTFAPLSDLSD